jgi:hypothetical protein
MSLSDQSELSDILNTAAIHTATHATAGGSSNTETATDFVEINGKSYLAINHNQLMSRCQTFLDLGPQA